MSLRPNEYPRASAALAGLGLTTQIAAAATDGIPIAKLVLGVVSRIVTLASDIEKSRDALHQLAADARKTGEKIPAAVSGRQLGPEMERSLEAIYEVLRSIESVMKEHKAKSAFRKALSYAFTTSKRIDGLSQELSRATQELLWVAALYTNAQVRENSPYIGEFRRMRLCDVDELNLITDQEVFSGYSSQLYSGKVKGRVVVLRCFERNLPLDPDEEPSYWSKRHRQEVMEHDRVLEKLSMIPNLHRSIARLYGKNSGEHFDRFNVIKTSGCIPIQILNVPKRPPTIDSTWNLIRQLLDAACYLDERGLSWDPDSEDDIYVDAAGVPIIGLHNDLCLLDKRYGHMVVLIELLERAYWRHWTCTGHAPGTTNLIETSTLAPRSRLEQG